MSRDAIAAAGMIILGAAGAYAQTTNAFGGGGADLSIDAMEPTAEPAQVGLAGSDPADIGRYLLATGPRGAQLSPDGETLAYVWSITGQPQIWLAPAAGGQPRQLTFGNGVTFFRWTPDGARLLYGADNDGDEQESYFLISADGATEQLVLPATKGGFRSFGDFADDGQSFVFASTERNGLDFDIYRGTLAGESTRVFEGTFGYFARALSPDGTTAIVVEVVGEDSDNLFLLDMESGDLTTVSQPDPRANHGDGGFAWTEDGGAFYFTSNRDREFAALMRYDIASGDMTVVEEATHDIGAVTLCGAGDRYLAWTVNVDGFHSLRVRDLAEDQMLETPALPEGVYGLDCAADAARMAIRVSGWRTPGALWLWDLDGGGAREAIAPTYAGLDPARLVRPESLRMTARDGVELQGLFYAPDAASRTGDGPPPALFLVHGGPTAQSQASFDPIVQYHVDRGVAVFEPNVRGSTGLGRTYVTLDDQEKRLDSVRDLVDMLGALGEQGRIDPQRVAVAGGSYGGYMVNAVLAAYPDAFAAGVSLFGVADWVTALEIASPALKASDRIEYGDITEERWKTFYTENSPIRQADQIRVPVLFSHGVMDPRIDIAETETMVKTLRANGVEAPFVRIPDEGHGWRKLKNRLFYYRREAEFLEAQLAAED